MKWGVKIMPRDALLDSQGRAVENLLKENHFQLEQCRVGRYVEISTTQASEDKAREEIQKMTQFVLYNPLIEIFSIERLDK
ncbi:MAG: phosphoribosylformylglycinamidine synthase subunit PurS [Bdellovibrionota bacterium]